MGITRQPGLYKKMRDILFKNLTSSDKHRKVLATYESEDRQGLRTTIQRHFIYIVREIHDEPLNQLPPSVYARRENNNVEKRKRFFCKIKGSICAANNGRRFLITFVQSLRINITKISNLEFIK